MGSCGTSCGITKERARDLLRARNTAARVHPGYAWSRSRSFAPPAVSPDALVDLARELERVLPARVLVRHGDTEECDSLYVLAGLHAPSLLEIKARTATISGEPRRSSETYIRIAVSPHGRFTTLQEIRFTAEALDGGLLIVEEPQPGVVDRRLQHLVKALQGGLRKARLVVLDLAAALSPLEDAPVEPASPDEPVSLWSLLFERTSPLAARGGWVASSAAEDASPCG